MIGKISILVAMSFSLGYMVCNYVNKPHKETINKTEIDSIGASEDYKVILLDKHDILIMSDGTLAHSQECYICNSNE